MRLISCYSCGGLMIGDFEGGNECQQCDDARMLRNFENDYYKNALKMDRFQPNYHTIENAMQYAKAQLYYYNQDN